MKQQLILIMGLILMLVGCRGDLSETQETLTNASGSASSGTAVTLNASVNGSVSSSVVQSSTNSTAPLDISGNLIANPDSPLYAVSNSCTFSDYSVYLVGGDGTAISSNKAVGGYFSADVNSGHEVIIEFDCGMKCIAKPGSSDLVCDLVANAVINSLEDSLGSTIKSNPLFEGLSIAKISEGVGEALKLISTLDATNNLTAKLEAATTAAEMKAIISQSSLGTLFTSVGTMAREKKAYNEAINQGKSGDQALSEAAAASWTIDKVVNMMVGTGMGVSLELDGFFSIYGTLFDEIDNMVTSNFVSSFRTYVLQLYNDLYENGITSNLSLLCNARWDGPNSDGDDIMYPPYKVGGELTCFDADGTSDTDTLGVTQNGGTEAAGSYRIEAIIKSSNEEQNRNDPTGIYDSYHRGMEDSNISLVEAFDEFMNAMDDGGVCSAWVNTDASDDEITGFDSPFYDCVENNSLGEYFSGLIGVYKSMRDKDMRAIKFSLDDIYNVLVGVNYMNISLGANLWQIGKGDDNYRAKITIGSSDRDIDAYMLLDDGTSDSGRPVFTLECASNGGLDLCGGGTAAVNQTTDLATFKALLAKYKPSYDAMMKEFENIPSMTEIKEWIFKSAHFEPYNLAGSERFHVIGNVPASGDKWIADTPIMCKIDSPNAAGDFVKDQSSITCDIANSVSWDAETGDPSDTSTYAAYYALQERGGGGSNGQSDRYYSLLNINNGTEYRLNGREFRIRGIRQGYADSDEASIDGTTLQNKTLEFCDTWEEDGEMKQHCWKEVFSYVAVSLLSGWFRSDDYWPYTWDVPMEYKYWDADSENYITETWRMPIAMTKNNSPDNYDDDWAVCVRVDENIVVTDTTNDDYAKVMSISLTSDTTTDLVDCFDNDQALFYYLQPQWGADSSSDQKYSLVRNDGVWMWNDTSSDIALINIGDLQSKPGINLGPTIKESWLNHYQVANLGHDAKFDPYCDDVDNDGECDCTDEDEDEECTLEDTFTEPTISDAPYWLGDASADFIANVIDTCKGKEGQDLHGCLVGKDDLKNMWVEWDTLMECSNSNKTMSWVDVWRMIDDASPTDYNFGSGCGISSNDYMGEVRMKNLVKRDNAYDIEKPNTILKLISSATASAGTGVQIGRYEEKFSFQEAMAMAYLRLAMPLNLKVMYNSNVVKNMGVFFHQVRIPGVEGSSPASGMLRLFMEKGCSIDSSPDVYNCQ